MNASMYKIEAYIRPNRLEAVQEALKDIDLDSFTVIEAKGLGGQKSLSHTFRGSQYANNLAPRTILQIFVLAEHLDEAMNAIQQAAMTGELGDGKLFVTPIEDALRIRTGERGTTALS
jgi:nitrogen regulatory protein P-II 1